MGVEGMRTTSLESRASTTDSGAYPCGLWFLMHYITVATSSAIFKQHCDRLQVRYNLCVQEVALILRRL